MHLEVKMGKSHRKIWSSNIRKQDTEEEREWRRGKMEKPMTGTVDSRMAFPPKIKNEAVL